MHVYVCMYMYVCMYVCMCVCMYVCMYVCMCMCVYAYMCMYVCITYWGVIVRGEFPGGNCPTPEVELLPPSSRGGRQEPFISAAK